MEMNHSVTYPLKRALIEMDNQGSIDMQSDTDKFCVSEIAQAVAAVGMIRMIAAWNDHSIPRHGIPNVLQDQHNGTIQMHPTEILPMDEAVGLYRQQGGELTDPHPFGEDPLETDPLLKEQRDYEFQQHSFDDIFSHIVSGNTVPFQQAIQSYMQITDRLAVVYCYAHGHFEPLSKEPPTLKIC